MKTRKSILLMLAILIAGISQTFAQARVQVIHNSADAAAQTVDVWLDQTLLIDNFQFRTATPFIDAPAEQEFVISITTPNSTSPDPAVARFPFTLRDGATYIIVANGIVSATGYEPNQPFNLFVYDMGRETSTQPANTDLLVFHGSTDAPMVDIHEVRVPAGMIVNDLEYAEFAGYLELPTLDFSIQVRDMYSSTVVAQYSAPLQALATQGNALTVVASGFLNPTANSNGSAFGLFVATPAGGQMIQLPTEPITTARAQIIHNSPDINAKSVDIWVNDNLFVNDLDFRTATPFVDVPAGAELKVDILPSSSTSSQNPVATFNVTFEGGQVYQVIANGLVSSQNYSPYRPFNLEVYPMAREYAQSNPLNTDVLVFHGSTDAPTVDVFESQVVFGTIIDDLDYAEFNGYLALPQDDYSLQIRDASGTNVVAQYGAPIATLGLSGQALSVIASGFLNPQANNNGPAFGLFVALPSGGQLIPLPQETINTARVQLIHNSSSAAAEMVDIWLNGQLFLNDFMFRTATPYVDAPANTPLQIAVSPWNSSTPIATFNVIFEGGEKYVVIANGEVGSEYTAPLNFNLWVYPMAREVSSNPDRTDLLIFHGSTDAPDVDLYEVSMGINPLWNDLGYGDFTGYLELPVNDYSLQVRDASGTTVVAQYSVPLASYGLSGIASTVVASGYLSPNEGQPQFGLWAALPSGGNLIPLPLESISTARVQIIHNSADAAAGIVDVRLNGNLIADDFAFRTATPFVDVPAEEDILIEIFGANSTEASTPVASFIYNLEGGQKYIIVANGVVSSQGFNPYQPFDLHVYAGAREMAGQMWNTDVLVMHGSTDAPEVDVKEIGVGAGTIVDNLEYGEFAGYLELPTDDYVLQITGSTGVGAVASYYAPLAGLDLFGESLTVVASGFLSPSSNNDGPSFGLWVALPAGGELIELPAMIITNVDENLSNLSVRAYPNPTSDIINVNYSHENASQVNVELFDNLGNKVMSRDLGTLAADVHSFTFDVSRLPEGMYFMRINAGTVQKTEKVQIVR